MRRRTVIQLIIVILLLACALAAYGAWYASLRKASVQVAALTQDIQAKSQDSARVREAKQALEALAADEASIGAYAVRQEDIVRFLEDLEQTGASLGSSVEVVSVTSETKGARSHIALSLKVTGSFDATLRTIGAIEYGPYDSRIQSLTFDTTASEATQGKSPWTAVATFAFGAAQP